MDRTGHELDTKKVTNHPIYQSEHPTMGTSASVLIRYKDSDIYNIIFFGIFSRVNLSTLELIVQTYFYGRTRPKLLQLIQSL